VKNPAYPDSMCDISEKDFWSAFRVSEKAEGAEHLEAAVKLGRAGKKAAAYAALARYHKIALADEWDHVRSAAREGPPPDAKRVRDVLRGKITGWHVKTVAFGDKIDWSSKEFGTSGFYGFHYLGWVRPVLQKFVRDGDERARRFLTRTLTDYYAARNDLEWTMPHVHPVYYPLGVAAKHDTCIALYLGLINTGRIPAATSEALLKLLLGFGRSMHTHVHRFIVHNIHTAGTAALLRIARTFPEFAESRKWERLGLGHMIKHADLSFFPDGGHRERCWGYGLHTLERMTETWRFIKRTGGMGEAERRYVGKLRNAYRWYAKSLGPGALTPAFGDGGLSKQPRIYEVGRDLFPKGKADHYGVDRSKSYLLRTSGFAIMRNGDAKDSAYANVTFGQFAGWHSHFDLLSMNFWALGRPLLEELGRFGSYDNGLDHVFRAPESHNQLLVDDYLYDSRAEPAHGVVWRSNGAADYFSAFHRAYRYVRPLGHRGFAMSAHLIVRRTIVFVKDPGYALVLDSVRDESYPAFNRATTGHWHSPRPFRVVRPGLARTDGSPACLLAWARPDELNRTETGADYTPEDEAAHDARYHLRARRWGTVDHEGYLGFLTVLYPFRGRMPEVSVRPVQDAGQLAWRAEAAEVRTPHGRDLLVLNPERLDGFTWRGRAFKGRALICLGSGRGTLAVD